MHVTKPGYHLLLSLNEEELHVPAVRYFSVYYVRTAEVDIIRACPKLPAFNTGDF